MAMKRKSDKKSAVPVILDGDINAFSYNSPDENSLRVFLQNAGPESGGYPLLKMVTQLATPNERVLEAVNAQIAILKKDSSVWVVCIGNSDMMKLSDMMPRSIQPALLMIKPFLSDSGNQHMLKHIIDMIHVPRKVEVADVDVNVDYELTGRYLDITLEDSVWSSSVSFDSDVVRAALYANGEFVSKYGAFAQIGRNKGRGVGAMKVAFQMSLKRTEIFFEEKMTNDAENAQFWLSKMWMYYWRLLYSIEGYSMGSQYGIDVTYSDDIVGRRQSELGLAYSCCALAEEAMESFRRMNMQYSFAPATGLDMIDRLRIKGVGRLSKYESGLVDSLDVIYTSIPYSTTTYAPALAVETV